MATQSRNLLGQYADRLTAALAAAVRKAAFNLEAEAKRLAPVDTGHLRNSIQTDAEGLKAAVGTNVDYAAHQEYGTHRQSGKPFLRPAADKARAELVAELRKIERSLK